MMVGKMTERNKILETAEVRGSEGEVFIAIDFFGKYRNPVIEIKRTCCGSPASIGQTEPRWLKSDSTVPELSGVRCRHALSWDQRCPSSWSEEAAEELPNAWVVGVKKLKMTHIQDIHEYTK